MRRRSLVLVPALAWLLFACEAEQQPLNLDAAAADRYLVNCEAVRATPLYEERERSCDGVDNDCDGLVDRLLPSEAQCATGLQGVCATGRRVCDEGSGSCIAPQPSPERLDGRDNDCDGAMDEEIAQVASKSRVLVWVPPALRDGETPLVLSSATEALDQAGLSYTSDDAGELTADLLSAYAVVLVPGYISGSALSAASSGALTDWVATGGRLVLTRLVAEGGTTDRSLFRLAGVTSSSRQTLGSAVVLGQDATFASLDSEEERRIPLGREEPLDLYTYTVEPDGSVAAIGRFYGADGADGGAAMVAHEVGSGRVFTMGYDLLEVSAMRCYVNCYEPGRDRMVVWLRSVLEEATAGHAVWKHAVPGTEDGAVLATHDVDAPDAHNDGPGWGTAGAIQMLRMEQEEGAIASWFVQTDYLRGIFNPDTIARIAAAGMTSIGGHSNLHLPWGDMPLGDCSVTQANYNLASPTVCGEIDVNLALVRAAAPTASGDIWRSPLLSLSPFQYTVLAAQGVKYDSSLALGDALGNFPIVGERSLRFANLYQGAPIVTIPVQAEDGLGFEDADGTQRRVELQPETFGRMMLGWTTLMEENAANGAPTVLLVHPSWGQGTGPENLPVKVDAVRTFLRRAKARGLRLETMDGYGAFWRGRDGVTMEARYLPEEGYLVDLAPSSDAPRFSLAFSDRIGSVSCSRATGDCPPIQVDGNRLVFDGTLAAGRSYFLRVVPGSAP